MLSSVPFMIITGCLLGFLSGLGVGGGSLLMLWLTLVLDIPHGTARIINLIFFIPSALIASVFRWRQGALKLKPTIPAIIAGCICAALFSVLGKKLDMDILKKLFGVLLIFTGLRELFYRTKDQRFRNAR